VINKDFKLQTHISIYVLPSFPLHEQQLLLVISITWEVRWH